MILTAIAASVSMVLGAAENLKSATHAPKGTVDLSWRLEQPEPADYVTWRRFTARGVNNAGATSNMTTEIRNHTVGLPRDDGALTLTVGSVNTSVVQNGELIYEYIDSRDRENTIFVRSPTVKHWTAMRGGTLDITLSPDGRVIAIEPESYDRFIWHMVDFLEGHGIEFVNQHQAIKRDFTIERFAQILSTMFRLLPGAEVDRGGTFTTESLEPANTLGDLRIREDYTLTGLEQRDGRKVATATATGEVLGAIGSAGENAGAKIVIMESHVESELAFLQDEGRVWSHRRVIRAKIRAELPSPIDATTITNVFDIEIERWFADLGAEQPAPAVTPPPPPGGAMIR